MGFKELASFNATMLGKQGWKIRTGIDSLVAGLFKTRYFPHTDFFGEYICTNPIYVCRSFFSVKNEV